MDSSGPQMPLWTKASMQLKNEIFQVVLGGKELLVVKRKLALTEREAGVSGLGGGSVDRVVTRVEPTWPAYVLKLCNCWLSQTFHFARQRHQQPASNMDQRTNQKVLKALSHYFVVPFCPESIIGITLFDVLICFLILQFSQSKLTFVSGTSWE